MLRQDNGYALLCLTAVYVWSLRLAQLSAVELLSASWVLGICLCKEPLLLAPIILLYIAAEPDAVSGILTDYMILQ